MADDQRTAEHVIVDHWLDSHPDEADPSWPTVARATIAALEADGFTVARLTRVGWQHIAGGLCQPDSDSAELEAMGYRPVFTIDAP